LIFYPFSIKIMLKMHQKNRLAAARLKRSTNLLAAIWEPTSKGKGRKEKGRREGKGEAPNQTF